MIVLIIRIFFLAFLTFDSLTNAKKSILPAKQSAAFPVLEQQNENVLTKLIDFEMSPEKQTDDITLGV